VTELPEVDRPATVSVEANALVADVLAVTDTKSDADAEFAVDVDVTTSVEAAV
jgi:hypothetical protein